MQSVIGGYRSFAEAQRAVRSIESQLSIQDVVIADSARSLGRKMNPTSEQRARWKGQTPAFLVAMTAEPEVIARATMLLQSGG